MDEKLGRTESVNPQLGKKYRLESRQKKNKQNK